MIPGYLSTGQAARLAFVSARTILKWLTEGSLKGHFVPHSRHRRVSPRDLADFLRRHGVPVCRELARLESKLEKVEA